MQKKGQQEAHKCWSWVMGTWGFSLAFCMIESCHNKKLLKTSLEMIRKCAEHAFIVCSKYPPGNENCN